VPLPAHQDKRAYEMNETHSLHLFLSLFKMTQEHLLLDPAIRDWVVIPMVILLVLVSMGRNYVSQLIKTVPTITENDLDELRFKQVLSQSMRLRMNGRFLHDPAFNMRKSYMIKKKTGLLREKVPGPSNPMSNPMAMMDMMKGNIVFMLPNMAMMAFVGYFFSGFVCLKIPFPLPSNHFKLMMQRGVDLSSLDVSYVSSLSWYFIVTFGLNGIMRLVMGGDSDFDDAKMMQMQVSF
jgi:ER membrane protein complex subunit 3